MIEFSDLNKVLDDLSSMYDEPFNYWMKLIDDVQAGTIVVHDGKSQVHKCNSIKILIEHNDGKYCSYMYLVKQTVAKRLTTIYKELPNKHYKNVDHGNLYKYWSMRLTAKHHRPIFIEVGDMIVCKTIFHTETMGVCDMATLITLIYQHEGDLKAVRKAENVYHLLLKEDNVDVDVAVEIQELINDYKKLNKDYSAEDIIAIAEQVISEREFTLVPYTNFKLFF